MWFSKSKAHRKVNFINFGKKQKLERKIKIPIRHQVKKGEQQDVKCDKLRGDGIKRSHDVIRKCKICDSEKFF